jgi:hypothetical protein
MRKTQYIRNAEEELADKLWYERHQLLKMRVTGGTIKIVGRNEKSAPNAEVICEDIWEGALASARRVEKKYGLDNLGPYDDLSWGKLLGKLSALRWVMGCEWDNLDS